MNLFMYLLNCVLVGIYYNLYTVEDSSNLFYVGLHALIAIFFAKRFIKNLAK